MQIVELLVKYFIHGAVIIGLAFALGKGRRDWNNLLVMAIGSALSFLLLDIFSPVVSQSARKGAGFGMGMEMVGGAPDNQEVNTKICESYHEFEKLKQSIDKLEEIYNSDELAEVIENCGNQQEQQQEQQQDEQEQDVEDLIDDMEDQEGGGHFMPQAGGGDLGVQYASY